MIFCICGYSQSNNAIQHTSRIIPPSPTVSELGRYGLIPVGYSTGTINPNIELYTFKTQNLTLPVSLTYNSNGIKVDEIASWTGMHWSLNAGGVVSRIVRDEADYGPEIPYPSNFNYANPVAISYIKSSGDLQQDTEADLFTFNFLGYTGKFVFDRNGEVICMPRNDLRIELSDTEGFGGFVITTPDGIKCTFEATESSELNTDGASTIMTVSAWYLTRIEHPVGDVINLTYAGDSYAYHLNASQTLAINSRPSSCGIDQKCPLRNEHLSISRMSVWQTSNKNRSGGIRHH